MSEHTPTPWRVFERGDEEIYAAVSHILETSEGRGIAAVFGPTDEANAQFIVRACNSHDDLLAALAAMCDAATMFVDTEDKRIAKEVASATAFEQARAVIAKAKG